MYNVTLLTIEYNLHAQNPLIPSSALEKNSQVDNSVKPEASTKVNMETKHLIGNPLQPHSMHLPKQNTFPVMSAGLLFVDDNEVPAGSCPNFHPKGYLSAGAFGMSNSSPHVAMLGLEGPTHLEPDYAADRADGKLNKSKASVGAQTPQQETPRSKATTTIKKLDSGKDLAKSALDSEEHARAELFLRALFREYERYPEQSHHTLPPTPASPKGHFKKIPLSKTGKLKKKFSFRKKSEIDVVKVPKAIESDDTSQVSTPTRERVKLTRRVSNAMKDALSKAMGKASEDGFTTTPSLCITPTSRHLWMGSICNFRVELDARLQNNRPSFYASGVNALFNPIQSFLGSETTEWDMSWIELEHIPLPRPDIVRQHIARLPTQHRPTYAQKTLCSQAHLLIFPVTKVLSKNGYQWVSPLTLLLNGSKTDFTFR
jgi:hypothetical protein